MAQAGATLEGDITDTGGEDNDERGFVWDTSSYGDPGNVAPSNTNYGNNWTETGTFGVGTFDHDVTSLSDDVTYYYRAVSHNSAGWNYGDEVSFTTPLSLSLKYSDTETYNENIDAFTNIFIGNDIIRSEYPSLFGFIKILGNIDINENEIEEIVLSYLDQIDDSDVVRLIIYLMDKDFSYFEDVEDKIIAREKQSDINIDDLLIGEIILSYLEKTSESDVIKEKILDTKKQLDINIDELQQILFLSAYIDGLTQTDAKEELISTLICNHYSLNDYFNILADLVKEEYDFVMEENLDLMLSSKLALEKISCSERMKESLLISISDVLEQLDIRLVKDFLKSLFESTEINDEFVINLVSEFSKSIDYSDRVEINEVFAKYFLEKRELDDKIIEFFINLVRASKIGYEEKKDILVNIFEAGDLDLVDKKELLTQILENDEAFRTDSLEILLKLIRTEDLGTSDKLNVTIDLYFKDLVDLDESRYVLFEILRQDLPTDLSDELSKLMVYDVFDEVRENDSSYVVVSKAVSDIKKLFGSREIKIRHLEKDKLFSEDIDSLTLINKLSEVIGASDSEVNEIIASFIEDIGVTENIFDIFLSIRILESIEKGEITTRQIEFLGREVIKNRDEVVRSLRKKFEEEVSYEDAINEIIPALVDLLIQSQGLVEIDERLDSLVELDVEVDSLNNLDVD